MPDITLLLIGTAIIPQLGDTYFAFLILNGCYFIFFSKSITPQSHPTLSLEYSDNRSPKKSEQKQKKYWRQEGQWVAVALEIICSRLQWVGLVGTG